MQSLLQKNTKIEMLSDVVVPKKFYERIDLGKQILNEVFGGADMPGIQPGAAILFTGTAGAGKSTMALQVADLLAAAGLSVLYNVGEENRYMVKMRADRLRLSGKFAISQIEEVDDLIKYVKDNSIDVLFNDSLQTLKDGDLEGNARLKSVAKKLIAFREEATDVTVTMFIVGHVTKAGVFAGPNEIKHDVDAHAHLKISPNGNRIFELTKNRFGPACIPYEFSIGANGLDFQQATQIEDEENPTNQVGGRQKAKREQVKALIIEKLLAGEKISGYDFDKYQVECSGGYWRGMLSAACTALSARGHVIGETRIDGRTHNFISKFSTTLSATQPAAQADQNGEG